MNNSARGFFNLKIMGLLFFMFLLILLMIISFDYMGIINLKILFPPAAVKWLDEQEIIKKYNEKSRYYRLSPDEQVRELTREYSQKIKVWEEKLDEREGQLDTREKELDATDSVLVGISVELIKDRGKLDIRIKKFEKRVAEYENGEEKLKELSMLYEKLEPAKAATIMEELPEPLVVKILRRMRTRKRSEVMAAMDDKKGAIMTKLMSDEESRTFNKSIMDRALQQATP